MCKGGLEIHEHLSFHCDITRGLWGKLFQIFGLQRCLSNSISKAVIQLGCGNPFSGKSYLDKCFHGSVMEDLAQEQSKDLQREVHEFGGNLGFYSTICNHLVYFEFILQL